MKGDVIASIILKSSTKGMKIRLTNAIPIFSKEPLKLILSEKIENNKQSTGQATMNATSTTSVKRPETRADSNIFFSFGRVLILNTVYIQPYPGIGKAYLIKKYESCVAN